MNFDWNKIKKKAKENETKHVKATLWTNRILRIILGIIVLAIIIGGIWAYRYLDHSLSPVDANSSEVVEVTIPIGATADEIAQMLEENNLTPNANVFSTFMRFRGASDFQAGYYEFSPSMDADQLIAQLEEGGEPIQEDVDTTVTVIEGMHIEEIAQMIAENTPFTEEEFMDLITDDDYFEDLLGRYPSLLTPLTEIEGLKYRLEGYLFPATYDYFAGMELEELINAMVGKSNIEYQNLRDDMENTWFTYHQILTLASIVEREAVTDEDRGIVAGVLMNRMDVGMPLQTDITVVYALGEHQQFLSYSDLETDSPYNTYLYEGLPPGPINSPSLSAIEASIYPTYSDYYYFVADFETGEIYYSSTIEEHEALTEQYVNPYYEEDAANEEEADEPVEEGEELPEEEPVEDFE